MRTRKKRLQHGNVELRQRADGGGIWLYRWWETVNGNRVRRGQVIGTTKEYPDETAALIGADVLRRRANAGCPDEDKPKVSFGSLVDKYIREEMPKRFSTRHSYLAYITNHIRPKWAVYPVEEVYVQALEIRQWLRTLKLASKSKAHIKCIMRQLFDYGMLLRIVPTGRNPMELVTIEGVTKREEEPRVLTVDEFQRLLVEVDEEPFRTMLLTDMCLGLRCSELLGLKWLDFDWNKLTLLVQRAVVSGRVDTVKTRYSKTRVPLDPALAEVLLNWKCKCEFSQAEDWVFASPFQAGQMPYRSWGVQQRRIRPAALRAGLGPGIGWHTLRHTYRSWLDETGAPLGVQQELMRHASIQTTMNIYGCAMSDSKREANSKVVQMVMGVR